MDAVIPYPWNSPHQKVARTHSSDKFADAFNEAQFVIALRSRIADVYPLVEFWKDKTEKPMEGIMEYIDPIIKDVLAKKNAMKHATAEEKADKEQNVTLLDDLVEKTEG